MSEPVDSLPFGSPEKARRYATERYRGAIGLNWYRCDPTLQAAMRRHLGEEGLAWAEPHLDRIGALMGGPIAERAEETDKVKPRLEKYDRWGHDVSRVVMPPTFEASKRDLIENAFDRRFSADAAAAGVDSRPLNSAWTYMLSQAEIGMFCALGTGGDMVVKLVEDFAPDDIKERVRELMTGEPLYGEASQMLTERTGGSDLAMLETTATADGDAWRLNGFKWFASNANGSAFVVLAKPEGAADGVRGIAPFLVLWDRRDGSRNGVRIRRLKDKLGTNAVASAEVEFVDAEAFMLAPSPTVERDEAGSGSASDGRGLTRMMEMTNGSRLGIAMMGLGVARRALVEAMSYARAREAFGASLADQPLMQRKIAELIVQVEAAQALVFDGQLGPARLRIGAPLIKLFAARLGITAASDAIEVHGGNGYIEQWPVARLLRDAQVNTIWEGPDNILCLDVRRGIERQDAHVPFLQRLRDACEAGAAGGVDDETVMLVRDAIGEIESAIERWRQLDRTVGEARLYPLSVAMAETYGAALLVEAAAWEKENLGHDRKALVTRLFARRHLGSTSRLAELDAPAEDLERFKELWDGALVDDRN